MLEIVPAVPLPPVAPSTLQVTEVSENPVTVALNCCVPLTFTKADAGEIEIPGGGGVLLTVIDSLALMTVPVFVHALSPIK